MTHHELAPVPTSALELAGPTPWREVAGAWLASFGSVNTQAAYRGDLAQFAQFAADLGAASPMTVGRPVIDLYARHLEAEGLKPATRARKLAAVASFLGYAASANVIATNPAACVRRPKVAATSPRLGATADEARRLITAAEAGSPTDRALVALCLLTGLRVSEALSITPASIRHEAGHEVLTVTGKGGTVATVPLSPLARRLLADAITAAADGGAIVRGPRGGRVDRHQAHRLIAALGRRAGLAHRLVPHDLRHAAATLSLEAGAPLHRAQDLLRHASPVTTQRYTAHRDRLDGSAAYTLATFLVGAA